MSCISSSAKTVSCSVGKVTDSDSLTALIKDYQKVHSKNLDNELNYYASQNYEKGMLEKAARSEASNGNCHPHQYRILRAARNKTLESLQKLDFSGLNTFESLYNLLKSELGPISGVGPLMIYDTALRIGAYRSLYPEKVYLHAGTRKGSQNLGIKLKGNTLDKSQLPEEIQVLEPMHIENFLCIYKDHLKKFYL